MKKYSPFDFRICALTKKPSFGTVTDMVLKLLRIVSITENSGTFDCQDLFQDTEMGSLASVKNGCCSAPWSFDSFSCISLCLAVHKLLGTEVVLLCVSLFSL